MNAPANMVVILACSKKKVPFDYARAGELYTGSIFTKGKNIAEQAGLPIWILSAKYGMLAAGTVVDNYDQKFKKPYDGAWPPAPWHGFYLGGQLYFKNAPASFTPLVPSMQMGYMLRALKELENDPDEMQRMIRGHAGAA